MTSQRPRSQTNYLSVPVVIFILFVLFILPTAASYFIEQGKQNPDLTGWFVSLLQGLGAGFANSIAIFFVIDLLVNRRRDEANEKQRLLVQLRSEDNATALNAFEEIWENGWAADDTLKGVFLDRANLKKGKLKDLYMEGAYLRDAIFIGADLTNTDLSNANFIRCDLSGANLKDAILINAKNLDTAIFSDSTTMPDGTKYIQGLDLGSFTNPK